MAPRVVRGWTPVAVATAAIACGGRTPLDLVETATPPPVDASTGVAVDECSFGTLVVSAPAVLGVGPPSQQWPSIAATPDGSHYFATWTGNGSGGIALGAVIDATSATLRVLPQVAMPGGGFLQNTNATYDSGGFAVIGLVTPPVSEEPTTFALARVGLEGSVLGTPTQYPIPTADPFHLGPWGLVSTSGGLATTWSSDDGAVIYAGLLRPDGTMTAATIDTLGGGYLASIAASADEVVVETAEWGMNPITQLAPVSVANPGWLGTVAASVQLAPADEMLAPLVAAGGNVYAAVEDEQGNGSLYVGTLGEGFTNEGPIDPLTIALAVDGCGRIVGVAQSRTAISVEPWPGRPSAVPLSGYDGGDSVGSAAIVGTPTGFGIVWTENGTVLFATLSWTA